MNFCFAKFVFNLSIRFRLCQQLFRIQIQKGGKVLLWNQAKSRMEACYSELVLANFSIFLIIFQVWLNERNDCFRQRKKYFTNWIGNLVFFPFRKSNSYYSVQGTLLLTCRKSASTRSMTHTLIQFWGNPNCAQSCVMINSQLQKDPFIF